MHKVTMFYDGGCPLCKVEVKHYQDLDKQQHIEWVDITKNQEILKQYNIPFDNAIRHLHVLDKKQKVQIGAYAFVTLWKELPYYRILAVFFYIPMSKFMLNIFYKIFAKFRYKTRCDEINCKV